MPKTLLQEIAFTFIMVIVMVYAMICYNIALNIGGMTNQVFLLAFNELYIMGPIAFALDLLLVGFLSKKITFRLFDPRRDNPFFIVLGISSVSVLFMCPLMSLFATILFKNAGSEFVAVWFQTTIMNFPMAFFWQIFVAGPVVRKLFALLLKGYNAVLFRIRGGKAGEKACPQEEAFADASANSQDGAHEDGTENGATQGANAVSDSATDGNLSA